MPNPDLNARNRKTLQQVFERPTRKDVRWKSIRTLFEALGAEVRQRKGSRIVVRFGSGTDRPHIGHLHEPHSAETPERLVESVRNILETAGFTGTE